MFVSFSEADQQKEEEVFLEIHRIHSLRCRRINLHNRRLDDLLKHNGMEWVPVYPDGNCCFTAASLHLLNGDTFVQCALFFSWVCTDLVKCALFWIWPELRNLNSLFHSPVCKELTNIAFFC